MPAADLLSDLSDLDKTLTSIETVLDPEAKKLKELHNQDSPKKLVQSLKSLSGGKAVNGDGSKNPDEK